MLGDKLLYVDCKAGDLVVLSLEAPANPQEISRCNIDPGSPSPARSYVQVYGDRVYALNGWRLAVIDGENLYSPRLLGKTTIQSFGVMI